MKNINYDLCKPLSDQSRTPVRGMKKPKSIKSNKVIAALVRVLGEPKRKSNHVIWDIEGSKEKISLPFHKGHDIHPGLLLTELKKARVSFEQFMMSL